jgi:hypothetical protein
MLFTQHLAVQVSHVWIHGSTFIPTEEVWGFQVGVMRESVALVPVAGHRIQVPKFWAPVPDVLGTVHFRYD